MFTGKRVCIFVDGENLRYSIENLFQEFDKRDYLPKKAKWTEFYDWIALQVVGENADRIRTYWYVVRDIDFTPFNLNSARKNEVMLEKILSRESGRKERIAQAPQREKSSLMQGMVDELQDLQQTMESRFRGWRNIQDEIAGKHVAVEFRRAGSIKYDLFTRQLGLEKAVDVKLATDLIELKEIYDIAVIVSGDQDYVPAVDAIKNAGKRTVNVSFLTERGGVLPSGARRLNQATDWSIQIPFSDMKKYLSI